MDSTLVDSTPRACSRLAPYRSRFSRVPFLRGAAFAAVAAWVWLAAVFPVLAPVLAIRVAPALAEKDRAREDNGDLPIVPEVVPKPTACVRALWLLGVFGTTPRGTASDGASPLRRDAHRSHTNHATSPEGVRSALPDRAQSTCVSTLQQSHSTHPIWF